MSRKNIFTICSAAVSFYWWVAADLIEKHSMLDVIASSKPAELVPAKAGMAISPPKLKTLS